MGTEVLKHYHSNGTLSSSSIAYDSHVYDLHFGALLNARCSIYFFAGAFTSASLHRVVALLSTAPRLHDYLKARKTVCERKLLRRSGSMAKQSHVAFVGLPWLVAERKAGPHRLPDEVHSPDRPLEQNSPSSTLYIDGNSGN